MRRPPFCMLVVLAAAGLGGPVDTSQACCNALPVISRDYQSTLGSVGERIAAPGHAVTITRKWCDKLGGAQPAFFDPAAAKNLVTIVFHPPDGGPGGTKTTTALSVKQCDRARNCVDCPASSPYPCNTLTFTMPDTDADLPPADGDGWTGPATITVTNGGATVAKIDRLYAPSDGCDCGGGAPSPGCQNAGDGVFMHFTVLPTPNHFQSLVSGYPLRMALDGGGNLLIPIHHPATAYGTPGIGEWERGVGTFCAVEPDASDLPCTKKPKMRDVLATAGPGTLQAFTIEGDRVAPIFEHDDEGALYGTADVEYSVLWVKSSAKWDVLYRIKNGKGPVRIDKSTSNSGSQFGLSSCGLGKLVSTRMASEVVACVDQTNAVRIRERAQAGKNCGVGTGLLAENVNLGPVTDVALEAQGSLVAFLKQGGPTVEAYSEKGNRLTPSRVQTATTALRVNEHALAVQEPFLPGDDATVTLAYFFDPSGELRTFNRKTKKYETVGPADSAAVLGQRAVTQPPTGPVQAHRYPWSTPANHSTLSVGATRLAIAPDLIAAAATGGTVKVWPWPAGSPPPAAGTVPLDANVATDHSLGIASACTGSGCTRLVIKSKTTAGGELRIFSFDPLTGSLNDTMLKAPAEDFVVGDRLVPFRTKESAGNDLNNDGDTNDVVMRLVAFDISAPHTPHVFETGRPAVGWNDVDAPWKLLGWRTAYQAVGEDVFFVTRECDQHGTVVDPKCPTGGTDLNRDGDAHDLVLEIYHHGSKTVNTAAAVGSGPVAIYPLSTGVSVQIAGSAVPENAPADAGADAAPYGSQAEPAQVGVAPPAGASPFALPGPQGGIVVGDVDQDGVLDGLDNCETSSNPAQFDSDRDGLGDRVCDPTYCTSYTPPPIATRGRMTPTARRAAFQYFMQLGGPNASLRCLERIATGEITGDPETLCRGSFVADVENLPLDEKTAAFKRRSQLAFLNVLEKRGEVGMLTADQTQAFRRLVRTFGESLNAATRVAYGQVRPLSDGPERDFQIKLGRQSVRHLETLVGVMSDCIDRSAEHPDAAAHCLGRIEGGELVFPEDDRTAARMRSLTEALRAATDDGCGGCILAKLDTCASDERRELDCPVCTNWRNAVQVIESVYGPAPAESHRLLARAVRK